MAIDGSQTLSDDDLERRARELFAQVRAEHPEAKAGRALETAGEAAGEVGSDPLGWLFGTADADDAGGDSGD